mgnify:CR=1 FL=1
MSAVTNIAAYKFARLSELKPLREELLGQCKADGLKGTILLSTEGINLFVAGGREAVEKLLARLRAIPGLEDLTAKYSESAKQPFSRMLVRIKKEIIAFGVEGIDPVNHPSPKLAPKTLKQWLDEGRPVTLLDTRNEYEVKLGTFKGALPIGVDHFREFPQAVARLPAAMKDQPIVMFCTGGIRCEKAGPFMEREGFRQIFQLDGGILKYFEECGSAHYEGECFVFDHRVGLDPALNETETTVCFVCQAPVTPDEQADPRYVPNESCPHCYKSPAEKMEAVLAERHATLHAVTHPLPGSVPADNHRPINVPGEFDGAPLLEALCGIFSHIPREEWLVRFDEEILLDEARQPASPDRRVRTGERYYFLERLAVEPNVNADIRFLHEDDALLVIAKPAPLPMHPCGRFNRNTLQSILERVYRGQRPRPAHRLDANTSGALVCARNRRFAKMLQPQFENGSVGKIYLARVQGHPMLDHFRCDAPVGKATIEAGARELDFENGLPASTGFSVVERSPDGTALLEVHPRTGRTNQIRLHLRHLGHPICGDPIYSGVDAQGSPQTLSVDAPPLCLHSWKITFTHPTSGDRVTFEAPRPAWAAPTE